MALFGTGKNIILQYTDLDIQSLIDLLAKHTEEYIQLRSFSTCTVEEIAQRKQTLWELQVTINLKRQQVSNTTDYIIPDLPDYNPPQEEQPRQ